MLTENAIESNDSGRSNCFKYEYQAYFSIAT